MKTLASPAVVVTLALLAALVSHPVFHLESSEDLERLAGPLVAVLLVAALLARASLERSLSSAVLALGATVALAGVAYDGARGHAGRVVLSPEGGTRSFEEEARDGRRLGLRPLGFALSLEGLDAAEASLGISAPSPVRPARLAPGEALAAGGFRLSWLERESKPQLVIGLAYADGRTADVELAPGDEVAAGDLAIAIERYFPDFALDAANQPFSRSSDPRNPAALLRVSRGDQKWAVFVLRAMPGLHNVKDLGLRFSLKKLGTDDSLAIGVHSEPGAALVAAGVALVALGFLLGARR